jgi:hypothetical protein
VFAASGALAQSNEIFLLQESGTSGAGNTLFIDQSAARDSRVGSAATPATQDGGGNTAAITLEGLGAEVAFIQSGTGNDATVTGDALASILLDQQGLNNMGTITVGGLNNTGELVQDGNGNNGSVSVFGSNSRGRLEQRGNNNEFDLEVSGIALWPGFGGSDVTVQQVGEGLTPSGVQVFTNAGTVVITQTQN